MLKQCTALTLVAIAAAGCTTMRETQPTQTAREQLMLSTAADQASAQIQPNLPRGTKIFVDASQFVDDPEYRPGYAVTSIQSQLLSQGYSLVGSVDRADTIAKIGAGALSIDQSDKLFGVPSIPIPIPLTGTVQTPEIAVYKKAIRTGVAKFDIVFYDARTGNMQDVVGPIFGFSHFDKSNLLGVSWKKQNIMTPEQLRRYNYKPPLPADESTGAQPAATQQQPAVRQSTTQQPAMQPSATQQPPAASQSTTQ